MTKKQNRKQLIIIGSGPAGLAGAIGAASEGLQTVLVDGADRFGGQAGTSTKIENFIGFPQGITGLELTERALDQATKFNVDLRAPFKIISIQKTGDCWLVMDDHGEKMCGEIILLALGVEYKALNASNVTRYLGNGISYGSPSLSENFSDKKISIVGSGNSAGQAACYLASKGNEINLIIRGESLEKDMSNYLIKEVANCPNIKLWTHTEIHKAYGDQGGLCSLDLKMNQDDQQVIQISTSRLFVMIGSTPKTGWLNGGFPKDENGYLYTGSDIPKESWDHWKTDRTPLPHELAPGIFVAGDVRYGVPHRIASAVGDAAGAVGDIHRYLQLKKLNRVP